MIDLSVIIVSYNTRELLRRCIESVVKSLRDKGERDKGEKGDKGKSKIRHEIIVVDNGSSDGSADAIRGIRGIRVIENKKNLGFGAANNQAAKVAGGEYLLFLNSDTEVIGNGIEKLLDFAKETERRHKMPQLQEKGAPGVGTGNGFGIGVIGGRLLNSDKTNQPSAGRFFSLPVVAAMTLELDRLGLVMRSPDKTCGVDWVAGACMLVKKKVFEISGGFDEGMRMYFEEVEWQYRLRQAGYSHYFYSGAVFVHAGGASSDRGFQAFGFYRGLYYFYLKHKKRWQYQAVRFMVKLKARLLIQYGKLTGNSYLVNLYEKVGQLEKRDIA